MPSPSILFIFGYSGVGKSIILRTLASTVPYLANTNEHVFPPAITAVVAQGMCPELLEGFSKALRTSLFDNLSSDDSLSRVSAMLRFLKGDISLTKLFEVSKRPQRIDYIVYESNFHALVPEFFYRAIPDSRLLFVVRDGRYCVDKMWDQYNPFADDKLLTGNSKELQFGKQFNEFHIPWWVDSGEEERFIASSSYVRAMWMWKAMYKSVLDFLERPEVKNDARVGLIKFEEMLSKPDETAAYMCSRLGLPQSNELVSRFRDVQDIPRKLARRPSQEDRQLASQLAEPELRRLGYIVDANASRSGSI